MAAAIELRDEYDGVTLRDLLKWSYGSDQTWRLLALAVFRWVASLVYRQGSGPDGEFGRRPAPGLGRSS